MRKSPDTHKEHDDHGVVALEFVLLVAPFMVVLIMAIAHFGVFFNKKVEVAGAAREAARTIALGRPLDTWYTDYPDLNLTVVEPCVAGDRDNNAVVKVNLKAPYAFDDIPIIGGALGSKDIEEDGVMRCGG